jgi:hypothetical protein
MIATDHEQTLIKNHQYNKLRKYRAQVIELENELKENKQQASSVKHKFAEYNEELHKKLSSLREQKKSWITEAVTLREKEKEAHVYFYVDIFIRRRLMSTIGIV